MIHASRSAPPDVKPLEIEGIRYQQVEDGFDLDLPARCGYLQAINSQTGASLWIAQIYELRYNPEIEDDVQESYFLRMKYHPEKREILIENERRSKYFVHIDTRQVRVANAADFPPKVQRPPPPDVPAIEYRGMQYEQIMNGHDAGRPERCGYLDGIDSKSGRGMWVRQIYSVPFNPDIEDDQQECYFTRMVLLPGGQDLLIENEAGARFLFNLKRRESQVFAGSEADYRPAHVGWLERISDACREYWRRWQTR